MEKNSSLICLRVCLCLLFIHGVAKKRQRQPRSRRRTQPLLPSHIYQRMCKTHKQTNTNGRRRVICNTTPEHTTPHTLARVNLQLLFVRRQADELASSPPTHDSMGASSMFDPNKVSSSSFTPQCPHTQTQTQFGSSVGRDLIDLLAIKTELGPF